MSWLSDALATVQSGITTGASATSGTVTGPTVTTPATLNTDASGVLASLTHSGAGDSLRTAADRLLGTGNIVDQLYGTVATAGARAGGPAAAAKPANGINGSTLMHYAPIIAVVVVLLMLTLHQRLFR
jgi:hypothetical protein